MAEVSPNFQDLQDQQELKEKIDDYFELFKEDLNNQQYQNVNFLLYNLNTSSDNLLYKVKYEIDQFTQGIMKKEECTQITCNRSVKDSRKAEILVKFQTLTSQIACHVLDDYKKIIERKKN